MREMFSPKKCLSIYIVITLSILLLYYKQLSTSAVVVSEYVSTSVESLLTDALFMCDGAPNKREEKLLKIASLNPNLK